MGLFVALGLAWLVPPAAWALEESQGGVTWTYSVGTDGAILTGANPANGVLAVPASLGGYSVVEIGYRAFASCDEMTELTIPVGNAAKSPVASFIFSPCRACQIATDDHLNTEALTFQANGDHGVRR